jgi:spore germination cell wall hydrolase CwlJ-like protein
MSITAILSFPTNLNANSEVHFDEEFFEQFRCLSTALYFEARGESKTGAVAVANVIMNRTKHSNFPEDVCGVVKQRTKYVCQFSWVCKGMRVDFSRIPERLKEIAMKALSGKLKDVTGGALFFHSLESNPWRDLRHTRTIGQHIFYKY